MKGRHGQSLPSQCALPSGEKVSSRYPSKEPVRNRQNRTHLDDTESGEELSFEPTAIGVQGKLQNLALIL